MRIKLLCVGQLSEKWLREAEQEYSKRLSAYCQLEIRSCAEARAQLPLEQRLETEGKAILAQLRPQESLYLLDLHGREMDSLAFSDYLIKQMEIRGGQLVFAIGGSDGFAPFVRERSCGQIALSAMTFTHQMSRILLLEQIYRAFRIYYKQPYHK